MMGSVLRIYGDADSIFERRMAFIPFYNVASLQDKINYCELMINKSGEPQYQDDIKGCNSIKIMHLEKIIVAMSEKIKTKHCENI